MLIIKILMVRIFILTIRIFILFSPKSFGLLQ